MLGTWPLALGGIAFALVLFALPVVAEGRHLQGGWLAAIAPYSRYFSVVFFLLGLLLLLRGRGELRRLAVAGLIGVLALNTLFTLTVWSHWDLRPRRNFSVPPNGSTGRSATRAATKASSISKAG